ncbi:cell division protein FtsA [Candidatus Jorgensenbacteria bacterium CG_4_10_14_0_8_um_filter_39_13]|uniref:Cell division protein FtsA n=2 Tax=Candidatus Joergenseniibacteriota TaxID=1752739 RepID=A0A2M7RGM7_9BACT|nr:MAG: cell division protein FtsA [Candidatus Jorgensenbacteria bacterium CG11_big_fil_rev_8_21_14_0_20_38_23]PIV13382.1 MAG: cell division protein FtsA [Candidatus Jorgensenbacteria bacterium CG03_land_8_20_14_0_80_38_39]PIW97392.1 MAG: cell division protein FtsA [Candidatus Jorgensenbacteria bacterium CG_4_8_14_3_um_filter_38_10]PIY95661.1 MAG: cell division protein FtsA [Candidatus Jorgensenbacteria bacterium CG_4_10_14_0_8_um_filter_39_13]PJA94850.1 MAG: cell division protein FtsA [Candida
MSYIVTSLDLGSTQIKGIIAERKKDGTFAVIAAFKQPAGGFRKGILVDAEEATRTLRGLILDLQKISRKAVQNIVVNINGEHVNSRPGRGSTAVSRADQEIHQEDIETVLKNCQALKRSLNYSILHNIIREFVIDDVGDISDPLGMTGSRLGVDSLIIEAFAPHFNNVVKCLERVGASVSGGLIFTPLAASRAVLSRRQKELGVLMIDFGAQTTSLAVYEENKIKHAKSLPFGSEYVTTDIAIGLKVPIEVAETLKITYGCALAGEISRREMIKLSALDPNNKNEVSRHYLAEIIEVRLAEILEVVDNELKVLGHSPYLPAGIVITGGGAKMVGTTDLIKQSLKFQTQIGYPNLENFEIKNPSYQEMLDDPEFAVAVGLILINSDENRKPINSQGFLKRLVSNLIP